MVEKDPGFVKAFFKGKLREELLFPYPEAKKEEEETLEILLHGVKRFCEEKVDGEKIDQEEKIPEEVYAGLKEMGVLGLTVPEEWGGLGLSQNAYAKVMEVIGAHCASTATFIGAHQSIGLKAILLFGTEEQKKRFLPELARGEKIACFALTEPNAGSDAAGVETRARLSEDGNYYILNGRKQFITNARIASVFTVFAKMEGEEKGKLTAFLLTKDMPGIILEKDEKKLGIKGSVTTGFILENVKVPKENVLGERSGGFKIAMEVLNYGRLGLGAGCLGGVKKLINLASEHAKSRKQFGLFLKDFEMIKEKLAWMNAHAYALEAMIDLSTKIADQESDFALEAAICKVFSSEVLWEVANHSLQIAGGYGYMKEYPYERFLRDSRINLIFEGTNEILRCFITLQGARELGRVLRGMNIFSFLVHKLKLALSNPQLKKVSAPLKKEVSLLTCLSKKFWQRMEGAIVKYKKDLIKKEFIQRKLADIMIYLYASYATLAWTEKEIKRKGEKEAQLEIDLCRLFIDFAFKVISDNLKALRDKKTDSLKAKVSEEVLERKYWEKS